MPKASLAHCHIEHNFEKRPNKVCSGKMAEKKKPDIRSLDDVLSKRLDPEELEEVNRLLYGRPTRYGSERQRMNCT